ncbi:hypothetical protein [Stenotrophomonas sp.]|uniref:hypothetical protein n=1 Tax=Stenotrophomonas sp. TaxID=69392 RepID=UPI00289B2AEC|nr:hypothetical protein [Stenotrophomonas sp.]
MSIIEDAICWDGVSAKLCMYVASPGEKPLGSRDFQLGGAAPKDILGPFLLEDEFEVLHGKTLVFYELTLEAYPNDLKAYLTHCSAAALADGAEFVWFQFDGGFDFESVLSQDFARDVYFLQPAGGVTSVAIDDEVRTGEGWAQVVLGARRMLIGGPRIRSLEDMIAMKGTGSVIDDLTPVSREKLAQLRADYPQIPDQFIEFLEKVGFGCIGDGGYMIYDGVAEPGFICSEPESVDWILLFGDDFSGCNAGFHVITGRIYEIDSAFMSAEEVANDFLGFIAAKISEVASW